MVLNKPLEQFWVHFNGKSRIHVVYRKNERFRPDLSTLAQWSVGVMAESNTPILHCSITPAYRNIRNCVARRLLFLLEMN
jgi:hypothetical protein